MCHEIWCGRTGTTGVLPKIPHSNCCKRVPNRPLRPRRGRCGKLLGQLQCGIFRRVALRTNHYQVRYAQARRALPGTVIAGSLAHRHQLNRRSRYASRRSARQYNPSCGGASNGVQLARAVHRPGHIADCCTMKLTWRVAKSPTDEHAAHSVPSSAKRGHSK